MAARGPQEAWQSTNEWESLIQRLSCARRWMGRQNPRRHACMKMAPKRPKLLEKPAHAWLVGLSWANISSYAGNLKHKKLNPKKQNFGLSTTSLVLGIGRPKFGRSSPSFVCPCIRAIFEVSENLASQKIEIILRLINFGSSWRV
jgi:hypothetical protein